MKYANCKSGIINIRITSQRMSVYKSLGIKIKAKDWSKTKNKVLSSNQKHIQYNKKIKEAIKNIEGKSFKLIKRYSLHELDSVPESIEDLNDESVSTIDIEKDFNSKIAKLEEVNRFNTAKTYKTALSHFKAFNNKYNSKKLTYDKLDLTWIKDMYHFLQVSEMARNSSLKVISHFRTRYRALRKDKVLKTYSDPFLDFSFGKEEVQKQSLTMNQLSELINADGLDFKLDRVRNSFLFQVNCGGIRVSDLFTMRFSNLNFDISGDCTLDFIQFKTKKALSLPINSENVKYLTFETNNKLYNKLYKQQEYEFIFNNSRTMATLNKIESYGALLHESATELGEFEEKWKEYKEQYNAILDYLYGLQVKSLNEIAKSNSNNFIFNYLNNSLFGSVKFDKNTRLNKGQHAHFDTYKTLYNKGLKELGKLINLNFTLHSHHARHSAANTLMESDIDVYTISKMLGHKKLTTTEQYLSSLSKNKVRNDLEKYRNKLLDNRIRIYKKPPENDTFAEIVDSRDPIFWHKEATPYIDAFEGEEYR
ncbi:MAG: tyrosine-type recombinase/integrase [Candidatus Paceibacterota bacterium]